MRREPGPSLSNAISCRRVQLYFAVQGASIVTQRDRNKGDAIRAPCLPYSRAVVQDVSNHARRPAGAVGLYSLVVHRLVKDIECPIS